MRIPAAANTYIILVLQLHYKDKTPETWDLKKHNWRNVGILLDTPLLNPTEITGVMLYYFTKARIMKNKTSANSYIFSCVTI